MRERLDGPRRVAGIAAFGLALLLVASCSGGDKVSRATPSPLPATSSKDLAQAMLLGPGDFPIRWVHKAEDPEPAADAAPPKGPLAACFMRRFDHEVARAIGGEWSNENTTTLSINPSVFIFDDAAHAAAGATSILAASQCVADTIGAGLDIDDTYGFGRTYTEPIDAAKLGGTSALREYNTQIYKTESPPHSDVLVFDIVVIVDGRVTYEVDGFQRYSPIDAELLRTYVEKARKKIVQPND